MINSKLKIARIIKHLNPIRVRHVSNTFKRIKLFGISFLCPRKRYIEISKKSVTIQNRYDLSDIRSAKKLIIFLIPNAEIPGGGIMSIYSLCKYTREIVLDSTCVICTMPGPVTYAKNNKFKNNEKIYRWEQVVKNAENINSMIIHVPEYCAGELYSLLKKSEIKFLRKIPDFQINIMNQNIDQMPEPIALSELYKLTANITQTTAHDKYACQEVCNKWKIPTHLFSVYIPLDEYRQYSFEEKEKIIVLSPDDNRYKEKVIQALTMGMPEFRLVTVRNMTFSEYMDLIARAYFTVTFGEGFDGYFGQPYAVGSIGFAVYNSRFFPSEDWKKQLTVYNDYDDMILNITYDMKQLLSDKNLYLDTISKNRTESDKLYSFKAFFDNLDRFYKKQYDYIYTGVQNYAK